MKKLLFAILVFAVGLYVAYQFGFSAAQPKVERYPGVATKYDILKADQWKSSPITKSDIPNEWNVSTKIGQILIQQRGNFTYCNSQKASTAVYYLDIFPGSMGGYESTSIVDCGAYYFVMDSGNAGAKLFGPFQVTNK